MMSLGSPRTVKQMFIIHIQALPAPALHARDIKLKGNILKGKAVGG
jgi:hypothetical protein